MDDSGLSEALGFSKLHESMIRGIGRTDSDVICRTRLWSGAPLASIEAIVQFCSWGGVVIEIPTLGKASYSADLAVAIGYMHTVGG